MPYMHKPSGKFGFPPEVAMASRGTLNWVADWLWYEPVAVNCDGVFQQVEEIPPDQVGGVLTQQWRVSAASTSHITEAARVKAQQRLDDWARTRNYDGILSLATYAASAVPRFAAEAARGVELRDATWAKLYEILEAVQTGQCPMPASWVSLAEELPALDWEPSAIEGTA